MMSQALRSARWILTVRRLRGLPVMLRLTHQDIPRLPPSVIDLSAEDHEDYGLLVTAWLRRQPGIWCETFPSGAEPGCAVGIANWLATLPGGSDATAWPEAARQIATWHAQVLRSS